MPASAILASAARLCTAFAIAALCGACGNGGPTDGGQAAVFAHGEGRRFTASLTSCTVDGVLGTAADGKFRAIFRLTTPALGQVTEENHPEVSVSARGNSVTLSIAAGSDLVPSQAITGTYFGGDTPHVEGSGFKCAPQPGRATTISVDWRLD